MLHQAIELLNTLAIFWADWVAVTFLNTAVLLAVLGIVWLVLRRYATPQIGYCLLLLVPLKLLVPVQIALPVGVTDWMASAIIKTPAAQPADAAPITAPAMPESSSAPHPVERSAPLPDRPPAPSLLDFEPQDIAPRETTAQSPNVTPEAAPATPPAPRPTLLAVGMLVWLAGVVLLAGRWFVRHRRFLKQLKAAAPIDPRHYPVNLTELCRQAGISSRVRFVESAHLSAPAVAGVFRPTMILPAGLTEALSPEQIEWAVLHELAHIRRWDLAVILLQRFAAILHFFNPAVWIANRVAHRLREYACDDLASSWAGRSPTESGEAFVLILRYAANRQTKSAAGLGILGLDARGACALRVRRMLDRRGNAIARPSRWSVLALFLVAAVALPHLRAGDESPVDESTKITTQPETTPNPKKDSTNEPPKTDIRKDTGPAKENTFEVIIVGPDNRPVPEAEVEFRRPGKPKAEDVHTGTFMKHLNYGTLIKANAHGRIVLDRSGLKKNIQFIIEHPGYGPYYHGSFNSSAPVRRTPDRVTVQLDAAWSVGSLVVDSDGEPISGVKIHPSVPHKRPPGARDPIGIGTTLTTDEEGRWHYDSVPESKDYVHVEIDHPRYMPKRISLKRADYGFTLGGAPEATVTLEPGLTMRGRVTDETGNPIKGALLRVELFNDEREATTDADGNYQVMGCGPGVTQIVVSAEGRAIDAKQIHIAPDMPPVNFEMQPGGTVRVRVLDHEGAPIPKARIFFQRWRGDHAYFAFERVDQYADEQGVWEWNQAPRDEFTADIGGSKGMSLSYVPLIAREEDYVFRMPPALVISGRVTDAETKEPIKAFEVVWGLRSRDDFISWQWDDKITMDDGTYEVRFDRQDPGYFVRVQAKGYQAAVSREMQYDEGLVTIDFSLKQGINVATQILTPGGEPASGAEVALGIADSQISVDNGHIDDGSTYAARDTADENGDFQFPPQNTDYQLVVTHPSGYAHVMGEPDQALKPITLTAWARIEGTFQVGDKSPSGIPITINAGNLHSYGENVPSISEHYIATTEPGGTFTFNRVVPGRARIGRRILRMVDSGAQEVTSSKKIRIVPKAGRTLEIQIGGDGRPVIGTIRSPDGFAGDILWSFADITLEPAASPPLGPPEPPADIKDDPQARQVWWDEWKQTEAGQTWTAAYQQYQQQRDRAPFFRASADRDGSFRIDDVPAGEYQLDIRFDNDIKLSLIGHPLIVPPITDENRTQAINLGTLTLRH